MWSARGAWVQGISFLLHRKSLYAAMRGKPTMIMEPQGRRPPWKAIHTRQALSRTDHAGLMPVFLFVFVLEFVFVFVLY